MIELRWVLTAPGRRTLQYRTRIVEAGMIGTWGVWLDVPIVELPQPGDFMG